MIYFYFTIGIILVAITIAVMPLLIENEEKRLRLLEEKKKAAEEKMS